MREVRRGEGGRDGCTVHRLILHPERGQEQFQRKGLYGEAAPWAVQRFLKVRSVNAQPVQPIPQRTESNSQQFGGLGAVEAGFVQGFQNGFFLYPVEVFL